MLSGPQNGSIYKLKYLKNRKSKLHIQPNFSERVFNKLSNDTQVNRLCTCDFPAINVYSLKKFSDLKNWIFQIFLSQKG